MVFLKLRKDVNPFLVFQRWLLFLVKVASHFWSFKKACAEESQKCCATLVALSMKSH